MSSVRNELWMVTENDHKFYEARRILAPYGFTLRQERTAKAEIQSQDLGEIALHALLELRSLGRKGRSRIVEDSGLFIDSLHGFPGPYSAYVHKTIGVDGVLQLLAKTRNRTAYFESAVAVSSRSGTPRLFSGRVSGRISREARGRRGFGFDPIFVPSGEDRTFAELGEEFKANRSHRAAAFRKLAMWLKG